MLQQDLFGSLLPPNQLETNIEKDGDQLIIPEGIHTIPCTHGIHRFAGKFIPNLPRLLLREILKGRRERILLDPFCGSGTTLVEAALEGYPFVGLDIDPLSVAISTVKTQPLTLQDLTFLNSYWDDGATGQPVEELIPNVPNITHWFSEESLLQLSSIKAKCLDLPSDLRLFSLIVFSSIVRRVSNADDQTQKTYVSHTLPKKPPLPSDLFPIFLRRALVGMKDYIDRLPGKVRGRIVQGDAVESIAGVEFDDVITSPPYIDSIDYVYNQMLEYFWLLDELGIKTYENFRLVRKTPMGFRIHSSDSTDEFLNLALRERQIDFDSLCIQIGEKSPKEERAVRSFFYDYAKHVQNVRQKQLSGAHYICVIGASIIRGVNVPSPEIIQVIHESMGYQLVRKWTYEIRRHYMKFPRRSNSGKIKQDHVLVFEAK